MDTSWPESESSSMILTNRIKNVKATSRLSMMADIQRLWFCFVLSRIDFTFFLYISFGYSDKRVDKLYNYYHIRDWLIPTSWFCRFTKKQLSQAETFIYQISINDFFHQFYLYSNSLTDQIAGNHGRRANIMQM